MKNMSLQHQELESVKRELRHTKIKGLGQGDHLPTDDKALFSLLPQKEIADQLVQIYVDSLESTYQVLHLPSFWEEYTKFWNTPQEGRPAFAAILLLVLASTYCIKERDAATFRGDSSGGRETATSWIRSCDSWLQSQSQKHTTMAIFQIHCLSFIAKQINSLKRKRTWTSAGNLMRLAISSGLHRDAHIVNLRQSRPSCKRVSVFDQEMRRRIWATISELELQAASDRGMPATLRDLVEDCGPPSNLDDEEFDPSAVQLPEPGPISKFTTSSFQVLSRSSWVLRLELVSVINGPHPQMAYEVVLHYDKKIMQHLDEIPHWSDKASLVSRVLLQLQLQILLLLLHRPYARKEARSSRYEYSAIMHLRSAISILNLHHQLTSIGNKFLCLFRNDILRAALSICYNFSTSQTGSGKRSISKYFLHFSHTKTRSKISFSKFNRPTKQRSPAISRKGSQHDRRQNHLYRHWNTRVLLCMCRHRTAQEGAVARRLKQRGATGCPQSGSDHSANVVFAGQLLCSSDAGKSAHNGK